MPIWLIFAALGAIAVTALLIAVLWRINLPQIEGQSAPDRAADAGGD